MRKLFKRILWWIRALYYRIKYPKMEVRVGHAISDPDMHVILKDWLKDPNPMIVTFSRKTGERTDQ